MTEQIEDLLHRRTDLSTFIVHLTKDAGSQANAQANLLSIVRNGEIQARNPLGMARDLDDKLTDGPGTQRVVCFSEVPLEHTWMMTKDIVGRGVQLKPYGLVFSKTSCRRKGVNPVWYLDITKGHDWLTEPIKELIQHARETSAADSCAYEHQLASEPILKLTPYIEQMGNPSGTPKEFWWEREWRHVGPFAFEPKQVVAVLAPEAKHGGLRATIDGFNEDWRTRQVPLLDPCWGLERMIAALARISPDDVGPFPEPS